MFAFELLIEQRKDVCRLWKLTMRIFNYLLRFYWHFIMDQYTELITISFPTFFQQHTFRPAVTAIENIESHKGLNVSRPPT